MHDYNCLEKVVSHCFLIVLGCNYVIKSISKPKIIAKRLNKIGGIIRKDNYWYLTEYAFGYNIFEYNSTEDLRMSQPNRIYQLDGTHYDGIDNTVCGKAIVFFDSSKSRINFFYIDHNGNIISMPFNTSKVRF